MAEFLLGSIVVFNPPAGSDYAADDRIDVYYDDSGTGIIVVYKNNVLFSPTSASNIGNLDFHYRIVDGVSSYTGKQGRGRGFNEYAVSAYSFCVSPFTLYWFRMTLSFPSRPYFVIQQTHNSPVCAVDGGGVCDIHFVGPVLVTNSASLTNPNGSLTALALSSNTSVKYGLSDFEYTTGGQVSGFFPNLGVGEHTVYAKDGYGCTTQISVFIFFVPEEQEHYRASWKTLSTGRGAPRNERLRIFEREYVGSVVEINVADVSPLFINKPKQGDLNNKLTPVHPVNAELMFINEYDYQYLPLFTQDNKKYHIIYEVDYGSGYEPELQWFISPSVNESAYTPGIPTVVSLKASDNVKELEEAAFTDNDGNLLTGRMKIIKILALIMGKTGLNLKFRCGINIFEVNHVIESDGSSDPLDQTYVDVECYKVDNEPFNCWDVLEDLLRPFGARIFQSNNHWIIEEIDRAFPSYDYRVFDTNGNYESNDTFNSIIDVKNPSETDRAALQGQDHSEEIIPAYGKISIVSNLNYIGSVRGGFEKEDLLSPDSERFSASQGVFISEEGFKDWSLRLNGTTGVSFGRVKIGTESTQDTRHNIRGTFGQSVGSFFFNPFSWSGNLRDAYVESAAKPYQYGPGDEIKLQFEHTGSASTVVAEFVVLRFVIKVGNKYLQQGGTWSTDEYIYREYISPTNDLENFEITVPAPPTGVVVDSTIQVRIYFLARHFFDFGLPKNPNGTAGIDGINALRAYDTLNELFDYKADVRDEYNPGNPRVQRLFYELMRGNASDDYPNRILPNDYDGTTNAKFFELMKKVQDNDELTNRNRGLDVKFYIDNVAIDVLINGQKPPEKETISLDISDFIHEELEVPLYNFDLPNITNAKNMYNNIFRLSDGSPTTTWARTGVAEATSLQKILLKVLAVHHSAPTFRLTGSFINEFKRIGINNYLRITKKGSSVSIENTNFQINLDDWTGDGDGELFIWAPDNSGSAEVSLTGAVNSERRYQPITHKGGHIQVVVNVNVLPGLDNTREDVLWLLFYRNGAVIYTEKLYTFTAPSSNDTQNISHIAFLPAHVDAVGFYIRRVTGGGTCVYQIAEFGVGGIDIQEIYQIADYKYDARMSQGVFELMQMSKTYISLAGVDTGGDGQSGGGIGTDFGGDFNEDFGGNFDTVLN